MSQDFCLDMIAASADRSPVVLRTHASGLRLVEMDREPMFGVGRIACLADLRGVVLQPATVEDFDAAVERLDGDGDFEGEG